MTTHPHTLLDAALTAARMGWPVFLLGRTKRPLANCPACPKRGRPGAHDPETCDHLTCHGFYAATRDPHRLTAMVAAHPDGLLAVRTGAAQAGAGVVGIDIDPAHGGRLHPALMAPTLAVATGNHGWHLYYRHPDPHLPVLSRPLPGMDGVDVKADGGYLVLPPSIHPTTRQPYRWANHLGIEEMPPRLTDLVRTPPAATTPTTGMPIAQPVPATGRSEGGRVAHPAKLVDACLTRVRTAPEGRRRVTLYGAARGVARAIHAGFDHDAAITLLTQVGRDAGQTDRDIHAAITGAFTAEGLGGGIA